MTTRPKTLLALVAAGMGVACTAGDTASGDSDTDVQVDTQPADVAWPSTLSATGLYTDITTETLALDVRTYSPAFPLWSDDASKERYVAFPPDTVIGTSDPDVWDFPVGTRAWKTFTSDGVRVETRYIERGQDDWIWVSYQWREDGSDADAVPGGVANASGTEHDIPDQEACFSCHQATGLLGVGAVQLGDDNPDALLDVWTDEGLLSEPITASTAVPGDGVEHEVLGYLHANCGSCHRDGHGLEDLYELRMSVPVGTVSASDAPAVLTTINAPTRHQNTTAVVVEPGDPDASQLAERMATRDATQMPPMGTEQVDEQAVQQVREWISGLPRD